MSIAAMLIAIAAFAVLHSLTAGQRPKNWIHQQFGERAYHGLYRIGYNIVSVVTIIPALLLIVLTSGDTLWKIESIPLVILFAALQLTGVIGLIISLLQIDLMRFAGLSQLEAYLSGKPLPLPDEPLQTGGVYRLTRHPLYLFSLMAIWFVPTMSAALFTFNIGATLYFVIGSRLEEQRMLAAFGETYRDYQRHVPWLIPFVRL